LLKSSSRMRAYLVLGVVMVLVGAASCSTLFFQASPPQPSPTPPESFPPSLAAAVLLLRDSLKEQDSTRIRPLIPARGVYFVLKWPAGRNPSGLRSPEFLAEVLDDALAASDPACLGLDPAFGTLPDRALVVFSDLPLDWRRVGSGDPSSDLVGFVLTRVHDRWEITSILRVIGRGQIDEVAHLQECPAVEQ